MAAPDLTALLDVWRVKRTELAGKAKQWVAAYLAFPSPDPDDPIESSDVETEPAQWWQHYGFASRPPADAESLVVRAGATFAAIASRVSSAVYGSLGVGDAAMFTAKGNVLRMNASDGSVTLLVPDGKKQWVVSIKPGAKGGLRVVTPGAMAVEMSDENGITLNAGNKPLTLASSQMVQIVAPQLVNQCGVVKLHAAAAKPLVGVAALAPGAPNVFI